MDAPHAPVLWPVVVLVLGLLATAWIWHGVSLRSRLEILEDTELATDGLARRLETVVQHEVRPLRRVAREIAERAITTPEQFIKTIDSARQGPDGVRSFRMVAWVNRDGQVASAYPPLGEGPRAGEVLPEHSGWGQAFARRERNGGFNLVADPGKRPLHWSAIAIATPRGWNRNDRGAIVAELDFAKVAAEVGAPNVNRALDFVLHDHAHEVIYRSGPRRGTNRTEASVDLKVLGTDWHLHAQPTDEFIAKRVGRDGALALAAGAGLSILASLGTAQALVHRRRERARAAAHLESLRALSEISAGITERPGASFEPLKQLTEVASRLMDMPMRMLLMYDPQKRVLRVAYRAGVVRNSLKDEYQPEEAPVSSQTMRSGQIRMIGDVEKESPESLLLLRSFGVRSFIAFPLAVAGEPTGAIVLAGTEARKFTEIDRQLAELWRAEAWAILSNRRLHEGLESAVQSLRQLLEHRETVYHVNSIIQQAASLREVLEQIAQLAPRALQVDACVVCLAQRSTGRLEVVATSAGLEVPPDRAAPAAERVVECSMCASSLHSGQIRFVEDTREFAIRGYPEMGSGMFVPLKPGGSTTASNGVLILLRREAGPFDPEQVRMAELFGSRAGSAIDGARLHDETRRQAETNAVLLRELNHRVGNNLASIVGLLSMGAGELPPQARQWLQRTIERVAMMARAHQMFTGGVQAVGLKDLAATTLASVSAVRGAGIAVRLEMESLDVKLPSSRAITFAMVLHELAYNAMVHALAGGGSLTVRGRKAGQGRILVEVVDHPASAGASTSGGVNGNGSGNGHGHDLVLPTEHHAYDYNAAAATAVKVEAHVGRSSGTGLQLVRNLVMRELRGSFSFARSKAPGGGSTAAIEIPIDFPPESEELP